MIEHAALTTGHNAPHPLEEAQQAARRLGWPLVERTDGSGSWRRWFNAQHTRSRNLARLSDTSTPTSITQRSTDGTPNVVDLARQRRAIAFSCGEPVRVQRRLTSAERLAQLDRERLWRS